MERADYDHLLSLGFTLGQIQEAKRMSAYEYLQRYMPFELVRCGRNEYQLKSHDSFKINENTSFWHWKSRDIGGKTALKFLMEVLECPAEEAVRTLLQEQPAFIPQIIKEQKKAEFILPERSPTTSRVEAYLKGRGISETIIQYCLQAKTVYEDMPYHNAVFVGFDQGGIARYASKRGTLPPIPNADGSSRKPYKREVEGSDKAFGFCIQPAYRSDTVAVYESAIDSMSHATILEDDRQPWRDCYRLAIGGVSAPKEGVNYRTDSYRKPPNALDQFLSDHPDIHRIQVCLDNDFAGCFAADRIISHYQDRYEMEYLSPGIQGDYNDLALLRMVEGQKKRMNRTEYIRPAQCR